MTFTSNLRGAESSLIALARTPFFHVANCSFIENGDLLAVTTSTNINNLANTLTGLRGVNSINSNFPSGAGSLIFAMMPVFYSLSNISA